MALPPSTGYTATGSVTAAGMPGSRAKALTEAAGTATSKSAYSSGIRALMSAPAISTITASPFAPASLSGARGPRAG